MGFTKKYKLRVQFSLFILGLLTLLFSFLGVFVYQFAEESIFTRNSLRMEGQLSDFVDMFDIQNTMKQQKVEENFKIAHHVFYQSYKGDLKVFPNQPISYKAVDQLSLDTFEVTVPRWEKAGERIQGNHSIVDKITSLGPKTATIFQKMEHGYLRIATNVKDTHGTRAVGTFIPNGSPVIKTVENGTIYKGRAFVVTDWYIVTCEPIKHKGEIVGMLVVGEQEKDMSLIKDKFNDKHILNAGHPFIIANNKDYKGLLVVDAYAAGENWFTTHDLKKREYFENLITAFNQKESLVTVEKLENKEVYSFETPSPMSDNSLIVYFQYYELYEYFIGIVIPKDDFITTPLKNLFTVILAVIIIFFIISLLSVSFFIRSITKPLDRASQSIMKMARGENHEKLPVEGKDEIADIGKSLNKLSEIFLKTATFAQNVGEGKFEEDYHVLSKNDVLGNALVRMRANIKELSAQQDRINWLQSSANKINLFLREEKELSTLANELLSLLAETINFQAAALYCHQNDKYKLIGSYAFSVRKSVTNEFELGEGLVGQAALEKKTILFKDAPKDFIYIQSGMGQATASNVLLIPLIYQDEVVAVLELGAQHEFPEAHLELLEKTSESVAIAIQAIAVRHEMKELLAKSIEQQKEAERAAAELAASEEELKQSNEMLEAQAKSLKESEGNLQAQQEELRVINEELQEKSRSLEIQKEETDRKNKELKVVGEELEQRALELESASQYKSEFLANMSHELRTPLNSMLILSNDLAKNKAKNLDNDQVESAEIIYKSGHDLLSLINDILDLSKIESGKMTLNWEQMPLAEIEHKVLMNFKRITESKNISLAVNYDGDLPESIESDLQRVYQVIKNLLSNAVKFTSKGGVSVDIKKPQPSDLSTKSALLAQECIAIEVKDTGIGIPEKQQKEIFEAFKQADGTTSRKYGGTGLGLSISRELTRMLGGEITLKSKEGEGSCFTLILPMKKAQGKLAQPYRQVVQKEQAARVETEQHKLEQAKEIDQLPTPKIIKRSDDRNTIEEGQKSILVIEDDTSFLNTLLKMCHEKGFKFLGSTTGFEGFEIAKSFKPDAIVLDIKLPDSNGWEILKKLKDNDETRSIPVHMMSAEEQSIDAQARGAIGFITKPINANHLGSMLDKIGLHIDSSMKNMLIVEDDMNLRKSIKKLIGKHSITPFDASSGKEAIEILETSTVDCMILDLGLPDMTGFELLETIKNNKNIEVPPIVVYTGKDLTTEENELLHQYTNAVIIKGEKSEERLLDETALFLHKVVSQQQAEGNIPEKEEFSRESSFENKTILLVDDDMRNVFALGKILKDNGMDVIKAANGKMALEKLRKHPAIDFVLLDIMMPEMDGFETLKHMRAEKKFKKLPVIALTAKAMKGDREKCIAAGASDYLTKPVDIDKLLSLMRVWLYK